MAVGMTQRMGHLAMADLRMVEDGVPAVLGL